MKRSAIFFVVLTLVAVAVVPAAMAVPPDSVTITATPGAFAAPDIEGCETGTWEMPDTLLRPPAGNLDKMILNIKVERTFVCNGGGGEFTLRFLPKVRGVPVPQAGPWRVVDGSIGGYDVHGTGSFVFDIIDGVPTEVFTGKMHIG